MLDPVEPFTTQRRRYKPQVGHVITLDLPGERIRAEIQGVVSDDAVVAKIVGTPVAKTPHGYQRNDTVCCRRGVAEGIGTECWQVISERELQQADAVARFEREERERAEAAERERQQAAAAERGEPVTSVTEEPKRKMLGPRRSKIARKG